MAGGQFNLTVRCKDAIRCYSKRMRKYENLMGQRFGRLVVQTYVGLRGGRSAWLCTCDCGNSSVVRAAHLKYGSVKSCGCLARETGRANLPAESKGNLKHGHRTSTHTSKTYNSWRSMRKRCLEPHSNRYKFYGGRGIKVCPRWDSFENFLEDMGEKPEGHSISRLDHNGHYEPGNCVWAPEFAH